MAQGASGGFKGLGPKSFTAFKVFEGKLEGAQTTLSVEGTA